MEFIMAGAPGAINPVPTQLEITLNDKKTKLNVAIEKQKENIPRTEQKNNFDLQRALRDYRKLHLQVKLYELLGKMDFDKKIDLLTEINESIKNINDNQKSTDTAKTKLLEVIKTLREKTKDNAKRSEELKIIINFII